jgi:metal-responsive CopG/Arc/MetJ family transcriptional regulator
MASGDAAFSVVISIEQLKRIDRAKNLAGESSRSAFVRDALESHIARRMAKPNLSGPGLDKGVGTYVKKIGITLSSSNNLEFLDEIVDSENTSRSRFVREFIDSFVD